MVINRRWENIDLLSFEGKDAYGQTKQGEPTRKPISVVWIDYKFANVNNPKYADVDVLCLTISDVDTTNMIERDGKRYNVLFTIPGVKYNQVFLKCLE